jgi:hypothetical protein
MAVIWDVAPCGLVDIDRRLRDAYLFHHYRPAILTEVYRPNVFSQLLQANAAMSYLKLGYDLFLLHTLHFIIN